MCTLILFMHCVYTMCIIKSNYWWTSCHVLLIYRYKQWTFVVSLSMVPRLTNNGNSIKHSHFILWVSITLTAIHIPQLVVHKIFPEELECFVEDAEKEAANHGANEAAKRWDSPKVKEDDFVTSAVEVHHHHHVLKIRRFTIDKMLLYTTQMHF